MIPSASTCFPVAAVILAAGEARRMGSLKQLLPLGKSTLLGRTIDVAAEAGFSPVIVVVGAEAEAVRASIACKRVDIVSNPEWRTGMGSSIRAGIQHFQRLGAESAAIAILVSDQPLVTAAALREMRKLLNLSRASVVAAEYGGTLGVPALFRRSLVSRLMSLPAQAGAKVLFKDPNLKVAAFALPEAGIDVDTPEDFASLQVNKE